MTLTRMLQRRGTAEEWEDENPILADGEIGVEKNVDPEQVSFKIGNGVTSWNDLPYFSTSGTATTLILTDSLGQDWEVTVDTTGHLTTTEV